MKGVVVESGRLTSAILLEDGRVIRRPGAHPEGRILEVHGDSAFGAQRLCIAACTAVLAGGMFFGLRSWQYSVQAYSYISMDEDSSIEVALNRYGNVIAVSAVDELSSETADLLSEKVLNKNVDEALGIYLDELSDDERLVMSSSQKPQSRKERKPHGMASAPADTRQCGMMRNKAVLRKTKFPALRLKKTRPLIYRTEMRSGRYRMLCPAIPEITCSRAVRCSFLRVQLISETKQKLFSALMKSIQPDRPF